MQKKICALCREGAVTDRMCQKWFVKFLGTIDILMNLGKRDPNALGVI